MLPRSKEIWMQEMYLTSQDIASMLGVHVETVRRWLRTKELRGIPFGHAGYRVAERDLQSFLARRQDISAFPAHMTADSPEDLTLAQMARVEQRTQQALEALLSMAEEIVHFAPDDAHGERKQESAVAQRLVDVICRVLGCQRASITTIDATTHAFLSVAVTGISPTEEQQWRERRPGAVLHDYFTDPTLDQRLREQGAIELDVTQSPWNQHPAPYGIQTLLVVSMEVNGQQVGILALDHNGAYHHFSPGERALAKAVGKLGAVVLEHERLLRERAAGLAQEEALREANRQMDEFVGLVSHELRTPLTSIKSTLQLVLRRLNALTDKDERDPDALYDTVQWIRRLALASEQQAQRQQRLILDLLDVTQIQAGTLEYRMAACDVLSLVRREVDAIQQLAPARPIHINAATAHAVVWADPDRIGQVLNNYLTNALKYAGGETPIVVLVEQRDTHIWVAVRDQGPGLSCDAQQHIWERYYRVPGQSSAGGLGLGLYICRMIIETHGGDIGVDSKVGEGATFWFTVPLAGKCPTPRA
jgi:excisionase family DNA binding protein